MGIFPVHYELFKGLYEAYSLNTPTNHGSELSLLVGWGRKGQVRAPFPHNESPTMNWGALYEKGHTKSRVVIHVPREREGKKGMFVLVDEALV